MSQVDVLLGILAVEVDVVGRLAKVWGARHARVPIGDIKSTRVTDVPITVPLDGIRIGRLFNTLAVALLSCSVLLEPWRSTTSVGLGSTRLANCWGKGRLREGLRRWAIRWDPTDCVPGVRLVCWSTLGWKLGTASSPKPAKPASPGRGRTAAAGRGTAAIVSGVASAGIANVERDCVQSFYDLVEGGVCCVLDSSKVGELLFLALCGRGRCRGSQLALIC